MKLEDAEALKLVETFGDAAKESGIALAVLPFVVGVFLRDTLAERLRARPSQPYVD